MTVIFLCSAYLATITVNNSVKGRITVLDVGQGQCIGIFSGNSTVMIDCGSRTDDAGESAVQFLRGQARTRLDVLVLTHLHLDHCNGAATLIRNINVERLILPLDADDGDYMLEDILSAAEETGVKVIYVDSTSEAKTGSLSLSLYAMHGTSDANERGLFILASIGEFDMLVTGDAPSEIEHQYLVNNRISHTELYIVGHHGSKYSSSQALLSSLTPDTAIISVGYNSYGHPTGETLERLEKSGAEISRTDEDGDVTIWIKQEKDHG